MAILTTLTKSPSARSLQIAVVVLGVTGIAQFVAFSIVFSTNIRDRIARERLSKEPVVGTPVAKTSVSVRANPDVTVRTVAEPSPLEFPKGAMPAANPTPVPSIKIKVANQQLVAEIVALAISLREKGDMPTALNRLREAQLMAPDQPQIVAEMALTYEKMGQDSKAMEQWQRVLQYGESAGALYAMADQRLKSGIAAQSPKALEVPKAIYVGPPSPKRGLFGEERPSTSAQEPGTTSAAKVISLSEVIVTDLTKEDSLKTLRLKATVQGKPGSIQKQNVQIQVLFYETDEKQHVMLTASDVQHRWVTPPIDWAETGSETLEVDYRLSPPAEVGGKKNERRNYFGYQVRLYYDNELQDVRVEPSRLLNDFPPPLTFSPE